MICPSCRSDNEESAESCWACRSSLSAVGQGTVIGSRYEIQGFLGRGGGGAVYRAHDRILDETVALKILRADAAGTAEAVQRFRNEIRLARRVSHPGVCRIHEYGEDSRLRFISMELVEGENLRERLRRQGPLPPDRAGELAAEIADALQAIHAAGIVHRDLQPLNVMLDASGRVRVMDFGIARGLGGEGAGTTGYVVGSPEYMSPEQARGRNAVPQSDLYSLGVVLFELLTARVPFRAETPVATLLMHLEEPPPLEAAELADVPPGLRSVLRRALAKAPEDRFASAAEMAAALRPAIGGGVAPPAEPSRATRWVWPLALAGVALLGLWLGGRRWTAPSRTDSPSPAAAAASPESLATTAPRPSAVAEPAPRTPRPTLAPALPAAPPATATPSAGPEAPTPSPFPSPTPTAPPATPSPTPPPATVAARPAPGLLLVLVTPWADVMVDGVARGQTPLRKITLSPGPHDVVLVHPDYQPYPRRVIVVSGQTFELAVDLGTDGVRKRR